MAERYWDGGVSSDPTNVNNWSDTDGGATPASSVPGTGDVAHFTANGNPNNCVMTAAWSLGGLDIQSGYTANFDCATYALTMDDGADVTLAGGGIFDLGSNAGNSVTNGVFDCSGHTGTFTSGSAYWTFNNACQLMCGGNYLAAGTIPLGSVLTIPAGNDARFVIRPLTINGEVAIESGSRVVSWANPIDFGASGKTSGLGKFWILYPNDNNGLRTFPVGAEMGCAEFEYSARGNCLFYDGGAFNSNTNYFHGINNNGTLMLAAQIYNFAGDVKISAEGLGNVVWDNGTNNVPSITIDGDLTLEITNVGNLTINDTGSAIDWTVKGDIITNFSGAGSFTLNRGTGSWTLTGTADQDIDLPAETFEDIEIDKSGGTVTFSDGVDTESLTMTDGEVDPNGQSITTSGAFTIAAAADFPADADAMNGSSFVVGGNCTLSGSAGNLLELNATSAWTLSVTGTAVITYCDIEWCDAQGGSTVDASDDTSNDGGNNLNFDWNVSSSSSSSSSISTSSSSSSDSTSSSSSEAVNVWPVSSTVSKVGRAS